MHSIDTIPAVGKARGVVGASSGNSQIHSHRRTGRSLPQKYSVCCAVLLVTALCVLSVALSGCGSIESNASAMGALGASTGTLSFR